ncbi:MAG: ABC transporter permease [Bacillota bacterium]|nr:ABC transporter permease [Bacillota bacterium]
MHAYALRKLMLAVPVLLGVSVLVFLIVHLTPGDPARLLAGPEAYEEDIQAIRVRLGLDQPLPVQYGRFLKGVVEGDLGTSFRSGRPVAEEIWTRFPYTVELASVSLVLAIAAGVLVGVFSAARQNSAWDAGTMGAALMGISVPTFWLGLLLMLLFSYYLGWLPASGRGGPLWTPAGLESILMPAIALGSPSGAVIARLTRSSLLEVLSQDYVRTARAKGLPERVVLYRHALKNALIPVVTVAGLRLGALLGGAVITEQVFAWPGVGTLVVNAINARDYPVVQGTVLLMATVFVLLNLTVDLVYGLIDPRIRFD